MILITVIVLLMTKQATTDKGIFIFGTSGREYTVTATRQGWQFTEIKKINDELYRVFIERDSYDI